MLTVIQIVKKIVCCGVAIMIVGFAAKAQNQITSTPNKESKTPAVFIVELKNGQGIEHGNATKKTKISAPNIRSILQNFQIQDDDVESVIPEHLNNGSTVVQHPQGWVYAVPNYRNMVRITVKKAESKKEFVSALKKLSEISGIEEVAEIKYK